MDETSIAALTMLRILSQLATSLGGLVGFMRKRPEVSNVTIAIEPFQGLVDAHPTLHSYVDVELRGSKNVAWHLNVRAEQEWIVDYYIGVSSEYGEARLKSFEERTADSLESFVDVIQLATSELIASALSFDFSSLAEASLTLEEKSAPGK